jgi:hypothetical protein
MITPRRPPAAAGSPPRGRTGRTHPGRPGLAGRGRGRRRGSTASHPSAFRKGSRAAASRLCRPDQAHVPHGRPGQARAPRGGGRRPQGHLLRLAAPRARAGARSSPRPTVSTCGTQLWAPTCRTARTELLSWEHTQHRRCHAASRRSAPERPQNTGCPPWWRGTGRRAPASASPTGCHARD